MASATAAATTVQQEQPAVWDEALTTVQKLVRHVEETKGRKAAHALIVGVYNLKPSEIIGKALPKEASDINTVKKLINDVNTHGQQAVEGFIKDVRFALYCAQQRMDQEEAAERQVNVAIIGLEGAGKSSLFYDLVLDMVPKTEAEGYLEERFMFRDKCFVIRLGGHVSLTWQRYFNKLHFLVFVVDASKPATFPEARRELEIILSNEQVAGVPLAVCANKSDQPGVSSIESIREALNFSAIESFRPALLLNTQVFHNQEFMKKLMQFLGSFCPFQSINQLVCDYARPLTSFESVFDWYFKINNPRGSI
jgi:signal recognition particle receptor subunit beta